MERGGSGVPDSRPSPRGSSLDRFEFTDPPNTQAFICRHVAAGQPVLYVSHDEDGDWQFLCGRIHDFARGERPMLVCLEDAVRLDPGLNALAGLCTSHHAERTSPSARWSITDDSEEFVRRCIADVGWSVQLVKAGDAPGEPAFAYTIGLHHSFGHPELIILGQPTEVMHTVLNEIGERIIKRGARFEAGDTLEEVIASYPVRLREVVSRDSFEAHVGYALSFYSGKPFRLFQVVWPDKEGRFPGEPGAWEILRQREPLLP